MPRKQTSPWVYVGIGCAVLVVIGVVTAASVAWLSFRQVKQLAADFKDPAAREAKVKTVLGCEEFPPGYKALLGLSVPFVFDMAVLSDRTLEEHSHGSGERGFIYMSVLSSPADRQDLREFLEGRRASARVLRQQQVELDSRRAVGRGRFDVDRGTARYVAQRGDVRFHQSTYTGLSALMQIDCASDGRMRVGIWFTPDPAPDDPPERANFSGTPADETALKAFMAHFHLCKAS